MLEFKRENIQTEYPTVTPKGANHPWMEAIQNNASIKAVYVVPMNKTHEPTFYFTEPNSSPCVIIKSPNY